MTTIDLQMRPWLLLKIFVCLIWTYSAQAADQDAFNLFDGAAKISKVVVQIAPNEKAFFVREFRGFASSNIGLAKLVGDRLSAAGMIVQAGAATEVEGRLCRLPRDPSKALTGFSVEGTVYLPDGTRRNFTVDVKNRDDAHSTISDTGEVTRPPVVDAPDARIAPQLDGTILRPSPSSPYGIEVLVEQPSGELVAIPLSLVRTIFQAPLKMGNIYAVRVHNTSEYEAAVNVMIDGLSRFALADDPNSADGRDLVAPRSTRTIRGYYRDSKTVDAFQVGEYSKSVAAEKLPSAPDVGSIAVTFAAAWKLGDPAPPNEPNPQKEVAPAGTVRGPKRSDPITSVERNIGAIRAVVRVRY